MASAASQMADLAFKVCLTQETLLSAHADLPTLDHDAPRPA